MRTLYVNHRNELTLVMKGLEAAGLQCYRIRTQCQCRDGDNRRDAVIAIHGKTVKAMVVRCRSCAKAKE